MRFKASEKTDGVTQEAQALAPANVQAFYAEGTVAFFPCHEPGVRFRGTRWGTPMDDDVFLERFSRGALSEFAHLDHVRVVYLYTRREGPDAAIELTRAGLRALTRQLGVPEKYHETVTVAWARLVGQQAATGPGRDFNAFINDNPRFRRKDLLDDYYSREVLFGTESRTRFSEPDLRPLHTPPSG
ncbi:hypothetical protein OV208_11455 [Corallococcus sp. bb12-1]|uniref:hypothetical protein n=1 Tax=Corallococcus sp. bb12-1 TaxID=2996784 RepID=UPI002271A1F2|nr:hypothetical protein [Corallococcus sp. bb12-1]MCY1041931.1 hypothetical protein [Corallococcus sp. bb12-1]